MRLVSLALVALLASPQAAPTPTPVIVELFTSEGCSSCPPADRLLEELERVQPIEGVQVIPLSFHVDYWNSLGWKDPFSAAAFSDRQRKYASERFSGRVYTPQMVVGGSTECVGNDPERAILAIRRQARQANPATVEIERIREAANKPRQIRLQVRAEIGTSAFGEAQVLLALTEGELDVDVPRGENAGRRLTHTGVVRHLEVMGTWRSDRATEWSIDSTIKIDRAWDLDVLRAVVFVQETAGGAIVGAATIPLVADAPTADS